MGAIKVTFQVKHSVGDGSALGNGRELSTERTCGSSCERSPRIAWDPSCSCVTKTPRASGTWQSSNFMLMTTAGEART